MKTRLLIISMIFIFFSCGSNNQNAGKDQVTTTDTAMKAEKEMVSTPKINTDSLVTAIENERERIEKNINSMQKKELKTKTLREQIKQKWSSIEYYSENGQIATVKTMPYKSISTRTEEFYFQNGKLLLAFINDQGLKYIGKNDDRVGKAYFYYNDEVIKEDNRTGEKETTIRTSDGERLLQEAKEYLELYPAK